MNNDLFQSVCHKKLRYTASEVLEFSAQDIWTTFMIFYDAFGLQYNPNTS